MSNVASATQQPRPNQGPFPQFPTHNSPRTWLITSSLSPISIRLIRLLLAHGDNVVACIPPPELYDDYRSAEFRELMEDCRDTNSRDHEGWSDRIKVVRCDGRVAGSCGAAVTEAVEVFGGIDILLCCNNEGIVGTVEEMSTSRSTQNLVREQFEAVFFSQVKFIKTVLPWLRNQHTGHIIALTSIGGHIGTPGMPIYTAAIWALEGYCDSLAYEVAPFNIKVTIVQPDKEILSLTSKLTFAPMIPAYDPALNPAPNVRDMLVNVLNTNEETAVPSPPEPITSSESPDANSLEPEAVLGEIIHRFPRLPPGAADQLVTETVHALAAIGGHENPPSRHIVGFEGASAVKEKLRTVTEEMEDFVEASVAVDIFDSELKEEARTGKIPDESPMDTTEEIE